MKNNKKVSIRPSQEEPESTNTEKPFVEEDEHYCDAVRESNHFLRGKLLAVSGFCELMVEKDNSEHAAEDIQVLREIISDINQMSKELSSRLNMFSEEHTIDERDKIKESIVDLFSRVKSSLGTLKQVVHRLLDTIQLDDDTTYAYKEKIQATLKQLDSYNAQ